jgi:mono/diheme cytochrome c family protein
MYSPHHVIAFVLFAIVFAFGAVNAAQSTDSAAATVWQGVYTEAQAARGQSEYTTHCANCHRDDLSGYSSILRDARFMEKYRETSLHLFFDKTKTTMPRGAPATLSDKTYVDIVSYVLKVNEFPAGAQELRVEDLPRIQLIGKDGPEPVPDFIRRPTENRLNITSLETLDPSCGE